ncbi:ionotropic receptor 75a-like [Epargyreus clarus]|uniref:ionotropic receptor 75a-like n=1 Tax=Epargyreus clarus TaxID=520877 RepID=UPI003C2FA4FC
MVMICIAPIILGMKDVSKTMSLDYFEENFVKFVCLLTCQVDWILDFTKKASNRSIAVSHANIKLLDESEVNGCLLQPVSTIGVILDTKCVGYKDVMYYASSNKLLDANHKWLLVDEMSENCNLTENVNINPEKSFHTSEISKYLEEIDISVNADITVATQIGTDTFDLLETFNFGKTKGGKFVISEVGTWDSETGLNISKRFKFYRRWDFQNLTLRMIVVMSQFPKNFNREMLVGRVPGPGVNVVTQIGTTILEEIANIHNFRYHYTITDQWIGLYERNATRVVSNSLYFGEQDISPVLRYFKKNADYIDIIHPRVTTIETRYYYRILSYGPGKLENQFLRPLSRHAWWCVVAMSVACGVVLLLAAVLEQRPLSGQYALFSVIASICQQFFEDVDSIRVTRPSTAGKLTILVTGIFCVLIYNYYTSSVVSWLLNGPPPSINSLWELLDSPLKLAYEDIGYTKTWLTVPDYNYNRRNLKVELEMRRKKVWNKKKGEPLMVPLNVGIDMIESGEYAYHMEVNTANKLISAKFDQKELCELGSLQSMSPTSLYPIVQKNSPYREFYIWSIARLSERGLLTVIRKRILSPSVVCEGSSPRALALGGAAPAFILLGIGYLVGLIVMMVERLVMKKLCRFFIIFLKQYNDRGGCEFFLRLIYKRKITLK